MIINNKIISTLKTKGFVGFAQILLSRVYIKKSKYYTLIKEIVSDGRGLEIGGISTVFQKKNILPIYPHIVSLDNCNFSHNTIWEGDIHAGQTYAYDENHKRGRQFVLEATDLNDIKDESYDFLLSSHMIEHTANPIKALKEWIRVVKVDGQLILLVPHKEGTFDHNRPVTRLEHLLKDYEQDTTEKDLTHLDEILELHDLSMDKEAGTHTEFTTRSKNNFNNRCLHQHVFDTNLVLQILDYLHLEIVSIEAKAPMHIIAIAKKVQNSSLVNNKHFFKRMLSGHFESPFISDKV